MYTHCSFAWHTISSVPGMATTLSSLRFNIIFPEERPSLPTLAQVAPLHVIYYGTFFEAHNSTRHVSLIYMFIFFHFCCLEDRASDYLVHCCTHSACTEKTNKSYMSIDCLDLDNMERVRAWTIANNNLPS